jgi:hypothetical protein
MLSSIALYRLTLPCDAKKQWLSCAMKIALNMLFLKGIFIKAIRAHIKACVPGAY